MSVVILDELKQLEDIYTTKEGMLSHNVSKNVFLRQSGLWALCDSHRDITGYNVITYSR